MLIYETHTQVNIQKMVALLKLNEMRSVIRNGQPPEPNAIKLF